MANNKDDSITKECLRKQLEECELLKSMYSNPGEFQSDTPYLINEIEQYLSGSRNSIDEKLDYRVKLTSGDIHMELSVVLGHNYPLVEKPMLIIRIATLSRHDEKLVKEAIDNFIDTEVDKTEAYMFQVVSWLQDNIQDLVQLPESKAQWENKTESSTMGRAWLWSHHIYSKIKRQDIMKLSKDYCLNGFMWPGKPGVICLEGYAENVEDVVKIIKTWNWQKLKLVKMEVSEEPQPENFFRFQDFQEIVLDDNELDDGTKHKKMDNSAFFRYLEKYQSGYIKRDLFGFE